MGTVKSSASTIIAHTILSSCSPKTVFPDGPKIGMFAYSSSFCFISVSAASLVKCQNKVSPYTVACIGFELPSPKCLITASESSCLASASCLATGPCSTLSEHPNKKANNIDPPIVLRRDLREFRNRFCHASEAFIIVQARASSPLSVVSNETFAPQRRVSSTKIERPFRWRTCSAAGMKSPVRSPTRHANALLKSRLFSKLVKNKLAPMGGGGGLRVERARFPPRTPAPKPLQAVLLMAYMQVSVSSIAFNRTAPSPREATGRAAVP